MFKLIRMDWMLTYKTMFDWIGWWIVINILVSNRCTPLILIREECVLNMVNPYGFQSLYIYICVCVLGTCVYIHSFHICVIKDRMRSNDTHLSCLIWRRDSFIDFLFPCICSSFTWKEKFWESMNKKVLSTMLKIINYALLN